MSVCFSILETDGCLIFSVAAISACAFPAALRSSLRLSTSSLSSRYRASTRLRRCFGRASIISLSVRPILKSPSPRGRLLQSFQMCGEAFIGRCDQLLVEAALAHSRFVAGDQQDTLSTMVKSESHCIESKLFHVGMLGPLEGV